MEEGGDQREEEVGVDVRVEAENRPGWLERERERERERGETRGIKQCGRRTMNQSKKNRREATKEKETLCFRATAVTLQR